MSVVYVSNVLPVCRPYVSVPVSVNAPVVVSTHFSAPVVLSTPTVYTIPATPVVSTVVSTVAPVSVCPQTVVCSNPIQRTTIIV
ncbi:apical ring associated protein 1, putative [Hepatocystis sp. ex Piliocolobus tephrosceles]|nr:apical ring associated protein 1, putative [Hepatocystis sp. ex Piliocolobus tephrosceles]